MDLSKDDLDMLRQWFDSIQDTNAGYLIPADYHLAKRIYEHLGMRAPESINGVLKRCCPSSTTMEANQ